MTKDEQNQPSYQESAEDPEREPVGIYYLEHQSQLQVVTCPPKLPSRFPNNASLFRSQPTQDQAGYF